MLCWLCAASVRASPLHAVLSFLQVGYATFYTMLPVFSLVLDEDVDESKVFLYPELYKELQKGRPLSYKTFFIWLFQSVYQGGVIMILVLLLFEARFLNIVSITFTALVASELLNVALEIHKWHTLMVLAEVGSVLVYVASLFFLPSYFGHNTQMHSGMTDCYRPHTGALVTLNKPKMLICVCVFCFVLLLFLCTCLSSRPHFYLHLDIVSGRVELVASTGSSDSWAAACQRRDWALIHRPCVAVSCCCRFQPMEGVAHHDGQLSAAGTRKVSARQVQSLGTEQSQSELRRRHDRSLFHALFSYPLSFHCSI